MYGHHEGVFYCESCYLAAHSKKCEWCKKPITGQYIEALGGRRWCKDHFKCWQCMKPIKGDTHRLHEKKLHCETCYSKISTHVCLKCDKQIDHRDHVESMGFHFHLSCFVCCVGDHKIGNKQKYFEHKDKTYCQEHWEAAGLIDQCFTCKKTIDNDYVKVVGKFFHSKCWKCNYCKFIIRTKNAASVLGNFYCMSCYKKAQESGNDVRIPGIEKAEDIIAQHLVKGYGELETAPGCVPPSESKRYPLSVLLLRPGQIPPEIDFRQREQYLEETEFQKVFGVSMEEFNSYPYWRRVMMKKDVGLF